MSRINEEGAIVNTEPTEQVVPQFNKDDIVKIVNKAIANGEISISAGGIKVVDVNKNTTEANPVINITFEEGVIYNIYCNDDNEKLSLKSPQLLGLDHYYSNMLDGFVVGADESEEDRFIQFKSSDRHEYWLFTHGVLIALKTGEL